MLILQLSSACCLQDTAIILKRESERLAAEKETLDSQVQRAEQVMERISRATNAGAALGLEDLQHTYEDLRANFPEEYVLYNLAAIALTQVCTSFLYWLETCCIACHCPASFLLQIWSVADHFA